MGLRRLSLLLALLAALSGCARGPEDAMQELAQLDLSFTEEQFTQSVLTGDVKAAGLFLKAGMDPNTADERGMTVLMTAAAAGKLESVKELLAAGANPQVRNEAGWTALTYAERNGWAEVMAVLQEAGAGGSQQEFRDELTKMGLSFDPSQFPKVVRSRPDAILAYVGAGSDPNARGSDGVTPLMIAAQADRPEVVRGLLSVGAYVDAKDRGGWTALTYAEVSGAERVVAVLQQAGAIASPPGAAPAIGRLPEEGSRAPQPN